MDAETAPLIADLLTDAMLYGAARDNKRDWLYEDERRAFLWLIGFQERRPGASVGSAWLADFIELNKDAIISNGKIDWNLRAARKRQRGG